MCNTILEKGFQSINFQRLIILYYLVVGSLFIIRPLELPHANVTSPATGSVPSSSRVIDGALTRVWPIGE